jgi:hypothetical protein
MCNELSEEDKEQIRIFREWTQFVGAMIFTDPDYKNVFKNPTREFILEQRQQMAEMGIECTPREVGALMKLISDTMDD